MRWEILWAGSASICKRRRDGSRNNRLRKGKPGGLTEYAQFMALHGMTTF